MWTIVQETTSSNFIHYRCHHPITYKFMPGRIVLKESDEALLAQVQVFSYDKTQQCYLKPDELLPLASYWFYVKEDCSLHFAIVAEEAPSPEVQ